MSVAPYLPSRTKQRRRQPRQPATHSQNRRATAAQTREKNLAPLSRADNSLPVKLQAMMLLHRSSSAVTCCLVTAALAAYGWTVCIPKIWSQEYHKLESLQRHERQLTETNEALKSQLARQAERSGLVQPNPSQSIFLTPTAVPASQPHKPEAARTLPPVSSPVAY